MIGLDIGGTHVMKFIGAIILRARNVHYLSAVDAAEESKQIWSATEK